MRRLLVLSITLVLAVTPVMPAFARGFSLPEARVEVTITPTGALEVTEYLTYRFDGSFRGGYREIPLRDGELISDVQVSEGDVGYVPGAPTELGSSGMPGSFGTSREGDYLRVVWHYDATNQDRTFRIDYRMTGLLLVYDDVADLNLRVWGDEWDVALGQLEATVRLPAGAPGELRVWGHPATVDGFTELNEQARKATLRAADIPPARWVEMRLLFPPRLLDSTTDAQVRAGDAYERIVNQQLEDALAADREERRLRWLKANAAWLVPLTLIVGVLPGLITALWLYRRFGSEPDVPAQPDHLHEPPGEEPPALVRALLETGHAKATGDAFTATLFDLIRRGYIDAMATTTIKKTWAGLKREELSDLSVARTSKSDTDLLSFEEEVMKAVVKATGAEDRLLLSEMKDRIQDDPEYYQKRFQRFKEQIGTELRQRDWWSTAGLQPTIAACVAFAVAAGIVIFLAMASLGSPNGGTFRGILLVVLGGILALNAGGLIIFASMRRGWERRSPEAAVEASKWIGFRRFLEDFEGIPGAVPGSIAIWEQYLCYGIAFGVAERVLEAAQLYAPPELESQSKVFWIDPHGPLGTGRSAFAITDLSHSVASAAPQSSGGFGGGGGGAW